MNFYKSLTVSIMVLLFSVGILASFTTLATQEKDTSVQLGPRPFYLINGMDEGKLKTDLQACKKGPFHKTNFSISHRGAALQFPEHTVESYKAAARMGAGIIECDVTFTKDRKLVCRHSQCDLHTTTNILSTDLASKCSEPFTSAEFDPVTGELVKHASAKCCTSDITLEEFKTLKGKMDGANPRATTVEEYMQGTAKWRTDLYSARGTLVTHKESIELFKELEVKMTPELKSPSAGMPFQGNYTQEDYAQQMIDDYKEADVAPKDVYPQSFNLDDVLYWLEEDPHFGKQAVFLDGRYGDSGFDHTKPSTWSPDMKEMFDNGVRIIAPPMWMLMKVDNSGNIFPSVYAQHAKASGLEIITWTFERSDLRGGGEGQWYYQTVDNVIDNESDKMNVLDVLAEDVGIIGIFSDWPASVTYYANCKNH
ncbi:MAG: glycerophosphodiester phosphodiesterase family protein [Candidatus Bipolaricaulota bacterium]|nr:glycerophosphodiester phosphodiesterase [Candidatus Bipolaricaulota bacterium]